MNNRYVITPSEEGTTTTIIILAKVKAVGTYSPIMIIVKGKRMKPDVCVSSPVWSLVRLSENGWITSELFLKRCQMFAKSLPKDDRTVRLNTSETGELSVVWMPKIVPQRVPGYPRKNSK